MVGNLAALVPSALMAALATWLLCGALARAVPLGERGGAQYLKLRAVRTVGRLLIVVVVVGAGTALAGGDPVGVSTGAVAGWLAATLPEVRGRKGPGGDEGAIG